MLRLPTTMQILECKLYDSVSHFTAPKFAISQSEAISAILISCDVKDNIMVTWPNLCIWLKYQIVTFFYASVANAWTSHGHFGSTILHLLKIQTCLMCCQNVAKRYKSLGINIDNHTGTSCT